MKESDLFFPVKRLLEEKMFCEVHGEVSTLDVVGIGKGYEIIVELKTSMSLQLLDQITDRVGMADYIFVAIPRRKRPISRSANSYLRGIGVGIILVDLINKHAEIIRWGKKYNPQRKLKRYVNKTTKNSIGGVTSHQMNSPYKITIENIQTFLRRKSSNDGWASVDEILEHTETHYSNPKPSVMATLQKEWNSNWIETKKIGRKRYFRFKK